MKKSKYSESRIISILNEHESGIKVSEITRKYCISDATFYNWKGKYGGMSVSQLKKLRELESENIKLKRLYADKSLECMAMKDVIEKKL